MVEDNVDELADTAPIDLSTSGINSPSKDSSDRREKISEDEKPLLSEDSHKTPKTVSVKPNKELQVTPPSPPVKRSYGDLGDSGTPTSSKRQMICKIPNYPKIEDTIKNLSKSSSSITSPIKELSNEDKFKNILQEAYFKSLNSGHESPKTALESANTKSMSKDSTANNDLAASYADLIKVYNTIISQNSQIEANEQYRRHSNYMQQIEALRLFLHESSPSQIIWQEMQKLQYANIIRNQEQAAASVNFLHALALRHSTFPNVPQTFPYANNSLVPSLQNYSSLNHLIQNTYQPRSLIKTEDILSPPDNKTLNFFRSASLDDSRASNFDHFQASTRCTNSEPSLPTNQDLVSSELALQRMYFQHLRPPQTDLLPTSQPEGKEVFAFSKLETPTKPVSSDSMSFSKAGQDYLSNEQEKQLEALMNRKKSGRALTGRHVRSGRGASIETLATLRHKLTIKLRTQPGSSNASTRGINKRGRRKVPLNRSFSVPAKLE